MIKTRRLTCSSQDGAAEEEGSAVEAAVGCAGTSGASPVVNKGTNDVPAPRGKVTVAAAAAGGMATRSSLAWLIQKEVASQAIKVIQKQKSKSP